MPDSFVNSATVYAATHAISARLSVRCARTLSEREQRGDARDREHALVPARDPRGDQRAAGMKREDQRERGCERWRDAEHREQRVDEARGDEVQREVGGVEERRARPRDPLLDAVGRDEQRPVVDAVRLGPSTANGSRQNTPARFAGFASSP